MPADPYARLLAAMLPFHNRFRALYASLQHTLRDPHAQTLPHLQLEALLRTTLQLTHHLDGHHQIEEAYIFPHLARRMPQFAPAGSDSHVAEHARMHAALEQLQDYAEAVGRLLRGSQGRKAINDGAGKTIDPQQADDDSAQRRKPWPTTLFDSGKYHSLVNELGDALFPHLDAEEKSLRPANLKAAGFTPEELNRMMI